MLTLFTAFQQTPFNGFCSWHTKFG